MVTNERQRMYAIESRKGGAGAGKPKTKMAATATDDNLEPGDEGQADGPTQTPTQTQEQIENSTKTPEMPTHSHGENGIVDTENGARDRSDAALTATAAAAAATASTAKGSEISPWQAFIRPSTQAPEPMINMLVYGPEVDDIISRADIPVSLCPDFDAVRKAALAVAGHAVRLGLHEAYINADNAEMIHNDNDFENVTIHAHSPFIPDLKDLRNEEDYASLLRDVAEVPWSEGNFTVVVYFAIPRGNQAIE
ncbi:hypothetical protein MRB53_037020 [Persea americana]|nr:hypothetical protein MRB53_037020 [Persea americana]